ncbi:MAG: hypothetical protein R3236_05575 [Phycisphaeraceae bacterium]|nr:hypothetical protein [Phycisphaeraceae bacterium]
MKHWVLTACLALSGLAGALSAFASAKPPVKQKAEPRQTIQHWIDRLNAESFQDREAATDALVRSGAEAVGPMKKLARDGKPEQASRAFTVLDRIAHGRSAHGRAEALDALKQLAATENLRLRYSAEHALRDPEERSDEADRPSTEQTLREQIDALQQELQNGLDPRDLQRTRALIMELQRLKLELMRLKQDQALQKALERGEQVRDVAARQIIVVKQNRTTYRFEVTDGGLTAKVTGPEGKETVFRARDAGELKKLSPEAHKVFQESRKRLP